MFTKKILFLSILLLAIPLTVLLSAQQQEFRQQAATATNTTVDFSNTIMQLAPHAFSGTISTYGGDATIVASNKHREKLQKLDLGMYRIPIQWNNGNPISSAGGGPTTISADTWIAQLRAISAEPMIVIGGSHDNNFTPTDAANLVRHFTDVQYWVIGNEPDNNNQLSMTQYCDLFNQSVVAMRAVDPTIKVAGPALVDYENYKVPDFEQFLQCAGNNLDILDFHDYGNFQADVPTNLIEAERYEGKIKELRAMIQRLVPHRAHQIEIQVGEYNYAPFANGDADPKFYQGSTTVWAALAAGSIAKAGGRGHQYADLNNPLGLTFERADIASQFGRTRNDTMPFYHGMGMFTGEGLFRHFGTQIVQAATSLPNVALYASTTDKNIVMINKNPTTEQTASVQLTGFTSGTVDVWQTDKDKPFDPPVKKTTLTIANTFEYILPPYSVTTFVLTSGAGEPTSTPTPIQSGPTTAATATSIPPLATATPLISSATISSTQETIISVNLLLHGLGKGGDNVKGDSAGNSNPLRKQRPITLLIFNTANQLVTSKQATITYDTTTGSFIATVTITPALPDGYYTIKAQTDHYLRAVIPGIHRIIKGNPLTLPVVRVIAGDITKDNVINIMDYNVLIGCYSDLLPAVNCADTNKVSSDISDDGKTNAVDYNLFLRELTQIQGE